MKTKILRKTDIALISAFLIFAAAFYFIFDFGSGSANDETVIIKVNGKIYAQIPLDEEKDVGIYFNDGTLSNIVSIKDGKAVMIYSDCPDGRCTRHKPIESRGLNGLIVCLPNKVTVEISGGEKSEKLYDIVI